MMMMMMMIEPLGNLKLFLFECVFMKLLLAILDSLFLNILNRPTSQEVFTLGQDS